MSWWSRLQIRKASIEIDTDMDRDNYILTHRISLIILLIKGLSFSLTCPKLVIMKYLGVVFQIITRQHFVIVTCDVSGG